jgi:proteic killer suppression protein
MIKSFKHAALKRLWNTVRAPKGLPAQDVPKIRDILASLNVATVPEDMDIEEEFFHFHALTGNRKGTYAVTVRGNWRITFKWDNGAIQVNYEDYHGK